MEFVRRVYGLYATGDKTLRYIGQTDNLQRRFIEHVKSRDAVRSLKCCWIAYCLSLNREVHIRTLEIVRSTDQLDCRRKAVGRETAWIRAATARGIRLLNGRLFEKWGAPKSAAMMWEYLLRRQHDCLVGGRDHEGFTWVEQAILKQIEKEFPQLDLDNSDYLRMYQLPLSA